MSTENKCICRGFYQPPNCPVHGSLMRRENAVSVAIRDLLKLVEMEETIEANSEDSLTVKLRRLHRVLPKIRELQSELNRIFQ